MTGELDCRVGQTQGGVDLSIDNGGIFSFNGKNNGQIPPFKSEHVWGTLAVESNKSMSVMLHTNPDDCVVVYNRGEVRKVLP